MAKPSSELSDAIKKLVERDGVYKAAEALGMSRDAVRNLAAGFDVREATITQARVKLHALTAKGGPKK